MKFTCAHCKKEFDYTVSQYGGYAVEKGWNLCRECWQSWIDMVKRHSQEITEWEEQK